MKATPPELNCAAQQARQIASEYVRLRADMFARLAVELGVKPSRLRAFVDGCIAGGTAMIAAVVNRDVDLTEISELVKDNV